MKTFTSFFALLFAFMLLTSSVNVNATNPGWTYPNGDGGQPLLQIFVYGVTLPTGTPAIGDQIAVFNGGTLAGLLTLTSVPSLNDWTDCLLIAYSYNQAGAPLYTPGQAFTLSYYDVSADTVYNAWTWGDGMDIDFHNEWYAPTSDIEATATTYGAYFPADGAYSYCYTNLTFVSDAIPTLANVEILVQYYNTSDVLTNVYQATISSGGYVATNNNNGTYTLSLFAGVASSTQLYDYTVTVAHATLTNETFDITISAGATVNKTVILDSKGDLNGTVTAYDLASNTWADVENAIVATTIGGVRYADTTSVGGTYSIIDIPDGNWVFICSYYQHVSDTFEVIIAGHGSLATQDAALDLQGGTIKGDIFDATTINLIDDQNVTISLYELDGTFIKSDITNSGSYELTHYGGTYKIVASSTDFYDFTIEEHAFYPNVVEDLNFNLLPTTATAYFDEVTGDPNSMWSIHIEMAKFGINSLLPWDEIAIFDIGLDGTATPKLVGSLRLPDAAIWQNSGTNIIKAFAQLSNGTAGFEQGHRMQFRAYDISHNAEYGEPLNWFFNQGVGTYHDTIFPDPAANAISYLNIYWATVPGQLSGIVDDDMPSAFVDDVLVEVLNRYTDELIISVLTSGGGLYELPLDAGTYNIRFSKTGYDTYTKESVTITESVVTTLDITLHKKTAVTMNYYLPEAGYYFIGRAVVTDPDVDDMLTLLDHSVGSYTPFSHGYFNSWVKNDDGVWLQNTNPNPVTPIWAPQPFPWELNEGYQVYRTIHYRFTMEGYLVEPENEPIEFPSAGIYYIPYFPFSANPADYDDAMTAFAGIFEDLDWVMDSDGNRLHHDNGAWVDNIGTLSPTQGYKVKMLDAATLTYPAVATKSAANRSVKLNPEHFVFTGGNAATWTYTIYIETDEFDIGDEIAAFSNGVLVGSMVIDSDDPWQNDLNTFNEGVAGGYEVGSPIELRAWDVSENIDYSVGFAMVNVNDACYTGVNYPGGLLQFSYAHVTRGIVSLDENQIDNTVRVYPNPVTNTLNIESSGTINQVRLYSVYGTLISNQIVNTQRQQMDVSNLKPGTYLIQLSTNNGIITKRVIIQ